MNFTKHTKVLSTTLTAIAGILLLTGRVGRAAPREKLLHDFTDGSAKDAWIAVNDSVMGGVSKGGPSFTQDGTMVFSGTLSLENRGGFSSVRTRPSRTDLSEYDHLVVHVRGDGRMYSLTVDTDVRIPAGSYRALIETKVGEWQIVRAPFSKFRATSFGRVLPAFVPLDRSKVESIGFLLADKKAGPFRLEVDSIKASAGDAAGPAPAAPPARKKAAGKAASKDIVDTAAGSGSFNTLVAAVKAAGLVETLKGKGPFTVFAPTDEAFAKLPKGTVESLLKPENKGKLTAILTYHVAAGRLAAGDVVKLSKATTLNGQQVSIRLQNSGVRLDNAKVIKTDIFCSNGVIHVIDAVIIPRAADQAASKDIVDTAVAAGSFKTLAAALKAAGLVETLKGKGPFTVFAPTDEAFAKLPKGTVGSLLKPENKDKLTAILTYHVAAGRTEIGRQSLKSLQGSPLNVASGDYLVVNGAKVVTPNIAASNGMIHVIDRVLLPELPEPTPADRARKLIELAIKRGVPLFNDGQTEACAAIYEITAKGLLQSGADVLTDTDRETLRKALVEIGDSDSSRSNAWTLRRALDSVYRSLARRK
jgi:transforming growth factor-beta-induced protein